jgi:hypothetical protein
MVFNCHFIKQEISYISRGGLLMCYLEKKMKKSIVSRMLDYSFYNFYNRFTKVKNGTFEFADCKLPYFNHMYNSTWLNERQLEIPIFTHIINNTNSLNILEIGNTYNHYHAFEHDIIDKYEKGNNVINEDITFYKTDKKYDLIFSISTFEHIGYNENEPYDFEKVKDAIKNTVSMLNHNGLFVFSFALGWNNKLDEMIIKNQQIKIDKMLFYKRYYHDNWLKVDKNVLQFVYDSDRHQRISRELFIGFIDK